MGLTTSSPEDAARQRKEMAAAGRELRPRVVSGEVDGRPVSNLEMVALRIAAEEDRESDGPEL